MFYQKNVFEKMFLKREEKVINKNVLSNVFILCMLFSSLLKVKIRSSPNSGKFKLGEAQALGALGGPKLG